MRRNEPWAEAWRGVKEPGKRVYQVEATAWAKSQRHKTDVRGRRSDSGWWENRGMNAKEANKVQITQQLVCCTWKRNFVL